MVLCSRWARQGGLPRHHLKFKGFLFLGVDTGLDYTKILFRDG